MESPVLSVSRAFAGKRDLFAGATGFVGKVTLSMLLHRYGEELDKVYVLVRKGSAASRRAPLLRQGGPPASRSSRCATATARRARWTFIRSKCGVLDGDITDPLVGPRTRQVAGAHRPGGRRRQLRRPGLLQPVARGGPQRQHLRRAATPSSCASRWGVPLVHMSTAFVAGNRERAGLRGRGGRSATSRARASWTGATSRSSRS